MSSGSSRRAAILLIISIKTDNIRFSIPLLLPVVIYMLTLICEIRDISKPFWINRKKLFDEETKHMGKKKEVIENAINSIDDLRSFLIGICMYGQLNLVDVQTDKGNTHVKIYLW